MLILCYNVNLTAHFKGNKKISVHFAIGLDKKTVHFKCLI